MFARFPRWDLTLKWKKRFPGFISLIRPYDGSVVRTLFIAILLVSLEIVPFAAEPPALSVTGIVHAGKDTFVAGTRVLDSMTILPGDELETRGTEFATVLLPGTSLRVLGLSRIRYRGDFAELISGQVAVATTSRFKLKTSCFEIEPIDKSSSSFDVVPYQGRIYISAQNGDILIRGKKSLRVAGGKTAAITGCGTAAERIELAGDGFPGKRVWGGAAAAGIGTGVIIKTQVCGSGESPENCGR